jgi:hypothetical protein
VVTLGARRHAALPTDGRPAPSVRDYDQLLTRPPGSPTSNSPTGSPTGSSTGEAATS